MKLTRFFGAAIFALVMLDNVTSLAFATSLTVTKTADTNDGICDSDCSLREAITAAFTGDTITFESTLAGQTIYLTSTLVIDKGVTINGSNLASPVQISGDTDDNGIGDVAVLEVSGSSAIELNTLGIVKGKAGGTTGGAGIANHGTLTIRNSTISGNSYMGGIGGGGIYNNGALTIIDSIVTGNSAEDGGGIFNALNHNLTITGSTFSNNTAQSVNVLRGGGGGVANIGTLSLDDSEFQDNYASNGGGALVNSIDGTATLTNCSFTNNSTITNGGAINNFEGSMTIKNCTFVDNSDTGVGTSHGGAIYNEDEMSITNSTFAENSSDYGGGIANNGTLTFINGTLSGNSALASGGGIANSDTLNYSNTIIANSISGGDCFNENSIGVNTNNLVENNAAPPNECGTPSLAADPNLGPLANNGGSTLTMSLLAGSPAIDAGDDAICAAAPVNNTSQNGVTRLMGAHCDIGSFEALETVKPTVEFSSGAANPVNTSPISVTVQFSEPVTGFIAGDITPGNGSVGNFIAVDGDTYTFDLTPIGQGLVTADILADVAIDAAGNGNTAASQFSRTYDSVLPAVTIDRAAGQPDPTNGTPINFTVVFSESVSGFTTGDVSLSGSANPTTGVVSGSGTTYNVAVSGMTVDGTVIAGIAAGVGQDAAANGNSVSTSTDDTVVYDATAPNTSITGNPLNPTNSTSASFSFIWDDGSGTGMASFECKLDAASFAACTGNPQTYSSLSNGSHTFQVRAIDMVGNVDQTPASFTWVVDTVSPTVSMSSTAPALTNISPIPVTVQFSEIVSNFVAADITAGNGTVGSFVAVDGDTYTFNLTPSGQGAVIANIAAGAAQDAAANGNIVAPQFSRTYDSIQPAVTINQAAGQVDPANNAPINFTVVFSETVTGFATGDVSLNGTANPMTATVTGSGTTYTVNVSGMTNDGTVIATIQAGRAQDAAANGNALSTSTDNTVTFDGTAPNDDFNNAIVAALPYAHTQTDIGMAATAVDDPVLTCLNGPGNNSVWYKVTPLVNGSLAINTFGSDYDTILAVWTGSRGALVSKVCNDDDTFSLQSDVNVDVVAGTTYYIEVAAYSAVPSGSLTLNVLPLNVDVVIGGSLKGSYYLAAGESKKVTYNLDSGPVKVMSTNGMDIVAALRDALLVNGSLSTFSQIMGLPNEQLSDTYWFPTYVNNSTLNGQLRFANVGVADTTVTVTIGGVIRGSYLLHPNEMKKVDYPLDAGPVKVQSSGGVPIVAALRDALVVNGGLSTFSQLMGIPDEQLSDTYWFPAYVNNSTLNGQLRFANVGVADTTVTVTIGGVNRGSYLLHPNENKKVTYNLDAGPVKVQSSSGVPIVAALREALIVNNSLTTFSQMMGLPEEQLSDTFWIPAYVNNTVLNGQLRFANVGVADTTVTVTIGGVDRGSYLLHPNENKKVDYALDAGPVKITSTGSVPIVAALRDALLVNGSLSTFSQMMGLPDEQLSTIYWLPAYVNNAVLNGQLRFGVP